jgi:hypothetical protein
MDVGWVSPGVFVPYQNMTLVLHARLNKENASPAERIGCNKSSAMLETLQTLWKNL